MKAEAYLKKGGISIYAVLNGAIYYYFLSLIPRCRILLSAFSLKRGSGSQPFICHSSASIHHAYLSDISSKVNYLPIDSIGAMASSGT